MIIEFSGEIWYWRGPAPFYFVTIPEEQSEALKAILTMVTYGWGMIPVDVRIGQTQWYTALFPKNGAYIVPIKDKVRRAEDLDAGDTVSIWLQVRR